MTHLYISLPLRQKGAVVDKFTKLMVVDLYYTVNYLRYSTLTGEYHVDIYYIYTYTRLSMYNSDARLSTITIQSTTVDCIVDCSYILILHCQYI